MYSCIDIHKNIRVVYVCRSMELMDLAFSNKMQLGPDGQYVQQYTPRRGWRLGLLGKMKIPESRSFPEFFWYFLQRFDSERCSFAWIFVALACDSFQLRISLPYFDIQEEGEASTDAPTQAQTRPHNCTQAWVSARLCRAFWTLRDGIPSMFQT